MTAVDLTPFGFTPTESHVYQVLLEHGPGTGYAIARAANLARANAYSALGGLVAKGAAVGESGRPKRYRPEPPQVVVARLSSRQNEALDILALSLETLVGPESPSLVEIDSPRAAVRLISHDIARAEDTVILVAPTDAYPLLTPVLRRAVQAGRTMSLWSVGRAEVLPFAEVSPIPKGYRWPGMPLVNVVDDRTAVIAARQGSAVQGHWGQAPAFVAAARLSVERLGAGS
jgi:sugar-specific transcriptional regulator TrmB